MDLPILAYVRRHLQHLPALKWLQNYRREDFWSDSIAGLIVAIMLVPQSMAYALLAGLPPQLGLYAGILPPLLYGIFGSSRVLAVGPVALVSLLVASGIADHSGNMLLLAFTLAFLSGIIQILMGLLHMGDLMNFISHPVLSGFTSAAALMIGISQAENILGINIPAGKNFFQDLQFTWLSIPRLSPTTLGIGFGSLIMLLYFKHYLNHHLERAGVNPNIILPVTRLGPFLVVVLGTLVVRYANFDHGVNIAVVGEIPRGLPALTLPSFDLQTWYGLAPTVITISLVGFLESISVARSLASKRRQKVDANQELIALGVANLGASFTGAYPVTGGLSRSVVNFSVGARSGLASILTAGYVALTVVFFTPAFTYVPKAILAAIILSAVANLVDIATLRHVWRYNKGDAFSLLATFTGVLSFGIELGILMGIASALILYLWRTSKPHIAIVGRVGESEHFRNVLRHTVTTLPHILAVRVDESLYFANAQFLEINLLAEVAERPEVKNLILICSAINFIDASALETLDRLYDELRDAGVKLHLAEVKGPVMDRLERVGYLNKVGTENIYLSTHLALESIQ